MPEDRPAIAFDLDGTIVDSVPDLHRAVNLMLADAGRPPITAAQTLSFIGHGIPNLVRLAAEASDLPAEDLPELTRSMVAHYMAAPAAETRPYPGVVALLETLRAEGWRIGLCTNKDLGPTREILARLDLAKHFDVVIGGDSLDVKKPNPAPLFAAFEALGGRPVLYVGDSEVDADTAVAAKLPFALFTKGYRKSPVEAVPHDIAFDDYAEVTARILALA